MGESVGTTALKRRVRNLIHALPATKAVTFISSRFRSDGQNALCSIDERTRLRSDLRGPWTAVIYKHVPDLTRHSCPMAVALRNLETRFCHR